MNAQTKLAVLAFAASWLVVAVVLRAHRRALRRQALNRKLRSTICWLAFHGGLQ